jgi:hypothetical protein
LDKFAAQPDKQQQLRRLLSDDSKQSVALILNERMLNIPPHLAPHMFQLLLREIKNVSLEDVRIVWSFTDLSLSLSHSLSLSLSLTTQKSYHFDHYLMFIDTYEMASKKQGKQARTRMFFKPEEEMFLSAASATQHHPWQMNAQNKRWTLQGSVKQFRNIALIEASKMGGVLRAIESHILS